MFATEVPKTTAHGQWRTQGNPNGILSPISGIQRNGCGALLQFRVGSFLVLHPKYFDVPTLCLQLKKMKEKKGLYPDKSTYTQQIGPGLCFGALALMLRFFFEVPGL